MKISKKEIILIVIIIFLVSAAVYYIYWLDPKQKEIEDATRAIEQKQIQLTSIQTKVDQIEDIKAEISALEVELEKQAEDIPKGLSQALQLVEMTNILNGRCHDMVISFNQSVSTYEDYQTSSAVVNFSTTYENLLLIFDEFKKSEMTNQIVNMNISYSQDMLNYYTAVVEGDYIIIGMTVEFFAFYKDPDAGPPEKMPFEDSPIQNKNPFRPTLN